MFLGTLSAFFYLTTVFTGGAAIVTHAIANWLDGVADTLE